MKKILLTTILAASAIALLAFFASDEKKIERKDVPKPVLEAFQKTYPNAQVKLYTVETEDGKKVYEIGFENDGRKMDVTYLAGGELLEVEETIQAVDLPEKVRTAINKQFSQFEMKTVEKVEEGKKTAYEVKLFVVESGEKTLYELLYSADGKLFKKEKEDEREIE